VGRPSMATIPKEKIDLRKLVRPGSFSAGPAVPLPVAASSSSSCTSPVTPTSAGALSPKDFASKVKTNRVSSSAILFPDRPLSARSSDRVMSTSPRQKLRDGSVDSSSTTTKSTNAGLYSLAAGPASPNSGKLSQGRPTQSKTKNARLAEALAAAYENERRMQEEVIESARVVKMTERALKQCNENIAATKESIVHTLEDANAKLQAIMSDKL
jgi:hypothetical protein